MRRWKLLLGALVALVGLVTAAAFVLWPRPIRPGLTQENYDLVQVGMSRAEVQAVLGPPTVSFREGIRRQGQLPDEKLRWQGIGGAQVTVGLDQSDRVTWKYSEAFQDRKRHRLDDLRWQIRRAWRHWFP